MNALHSTPGVVGVVANGANAICSGKLSES
jgi:hypothetical protein